jgi:hypothetical protein
MQRVYSYPIDFYLTILYVANLVNQGIVMHKDKQQLVQLVVLDTRI